MICDEKTPFRLYTRPVENDVSRNPYFGGYERCMDTEEMILDKGLTVIMGGKQVMLGVFNHELDMRHCAHYMRCGDGYEWKNVEIAPLPGDPDIGTLFSAKTHIWPPYGIRRLMVCSRKKNAPSLRTIARVQRIRNLAEASGDNLYFTFNDEGVAMDTHSETYPYPDRYMEMYSEPLFRPLWE